MTAALVFKVAGLLACVFVGIVVLRSKSDRDEETRARIRRRERGL